MHVQWIEYFINCSYWYLIDRLCLKKFVRFRFPTDPDQLHATQKFFLEVLEIL